MIKTFSNTQHCFSGAQNTLNETFLWLGRLGLEHERLGSWWKESDGKIGFFRYFGYLRHMQMFAKDQRDTKIFKWVWGIQKTQVCALQTSASMCKCSKYDKNCNFPHIFSVFWISKAHADVCKGPKGYKNLQMGLGDPKNTNSCFANICIDMQTLEMWQKSLFPIHFLSVLGFWGTCRCLQKTKGIQKSSNGSGGSKKHKFMLCKHLHRCANAQNVTKIPISHIFSQCFGFLGHMQMFAKDQRGIKSFK